MNHTARTARTASENLQHVLDHWDHLRELIDTVGPGAAGGTWPPDRPGSEYLRRLDEQDTAEQQFAAALAHAIDHPQRLVTTRHHTGQLYYRCAFCEHVGEGLPHPVREDRGGSQLGEHPTPIRLHVVDACRAIEIALCHLADDIASRDALDSADWHHGVREDRTAPTAAGWLLARLTAAPGPCCPAHDAERDRIGRYAADAADRIDRVLGTGRRAVTLPMPCPWCAGDLVMHSEAGTVLSVTCSTGLIDCNAPVPFVVDQRARVWSTTQQLAALQTALSAAEARQAEAERRARRTEDRRRQRETARERETAA